MCPQGPLSELPVISPEPEGDRLFNDAAEAVADLRRRYDVATRFLREHFTKVMKGAVQKGRYRAFYPQVSVTTGSFAKVDSRLSFGHVTEPGTYATTITRPDLFQGYLFGRPGPADALVQSVASATVAPASRKRRPSG